MSLLIFFILFTLFCFFRVRSCEKRKIYKDERPKDCNNDKGFFAFNKLITVQVHSSNVPETQKLVSTTDYRVMLNVIDS